MANRSENKPRVNVTIDKEVYDWLLAKVEDHTFANISHGVEYCLFKEKNKGEKP